MRRGEIIERTLAIMSYRRDHGAEVSGTHQTFDCDEIVISELERRLLVSHDFKTCEDFAYLKVSCCETCHALYPHYDMYVQSLPDGDYAWICCAIRSATLGIETSHFGMDDEPVDIIEMLDKLCNVAAKLTKRRPARLRRAL